MDWDIFFISLGRDFLIAFNDSVKDINYEET